MSDGSSLTDTSLVVAMWDRLSTGLNIDDSWVGTQSQRLSAFLSIALQASGLVALGTILARWARASFLYRWLTTEPNPEIIVIDLRETYTVGPFLLVLDRIIGTLAGGWETASIGSLTETVHNSLREHPVRTVSMVALTALLASLAVAVAFGTLTTMGLGVRLVAVALAALGTRIRVSWAQCTESASYRYLVAALEPPEPPEANESDGGPER